MKRRIAFLKNQEIDHRSNEKGLSRRKVLGMLSAVGAGMAVAPRSFAQNVAGGGRIIDTHHHIFPPKFTSQNLRPLTDTPGGSSNFYTRWSPHFSLEQMDKSGRAPAIGSITS